MQLLLCLMLPYMLQPNIRHFKLLWTMLKRCVLWQWQDPECTAAGSSEVNGPQGVCQQERSKVHFAWVRKYNDVTQKKYEIKTGFVNTWLSVSCCHIKRNTYTRITPRMCCIGLLHVQRQHDAGAVHGFWRWRNVCCAYRDSMALVPYTGSDDDVMFVVRTETAWR